MWPRGLALAFFLSGLAGLVYETTWSRLLRTSFGGTTEALATVLAAFMGGLALGSPLGGRLADRRGPRASFRLYAHLELGIAVFSLLTALLLPHFPPLYARLEAGIGAGRAARALSAAVLLLPPTFLMGATLPILARAAVGLGGPLGRTVAALYAVNTSGAVAGALATGFVLLPLLGLSRSIYLATLLNLAAAALCYRLADRLPAATDPVAPLPAAGPAAIAPAAPRRIRALVLFSAAVSGAVALGLEVLWTRTLLLTVGSTTHAIALMLATFLGGIALGSALYGRFFAADANPARTAASAQVAIAIGSLLLLRLAGTLPLLYLSLFERVRDAPFGLLLLRLVPAAALMLLPALLMGVSLPALIRAVAGPGSVGRDVGAVYAANTAGAIAGPLLVGLLALPRLGVTRATAAVAGLELLAAAAAFLASPMRGSRRALALLAMLALYLPLAAWPPLSDPRLSGIGVAWLADRLGPLWQEGGLAERLGKFRVLHHSDGAESTVMVYDAGPGTKRSFVVNGRHEAGSVPRDMRNQYLLGHLPALLHRGPVAEGLVIALGSGMTAGCLARHAERVTVVELEPEVLKAAALFAEENHDVLADPRVRVVIDDGRHFLLTTDRRFDVITVDPIHPSVVGSETLYSLEQYRLVRARLAAGGIAAQWLPLYWVGVEDARTIAATFHAVFPDAQAWVNGGDVVLIGGTGAELRPAAEIRDQLARPGSAASLLRVRQHRLATLLAGYALGPPDFADFVRGARLSTDDRPVLEFSLPRQMYTSTVDADLLEIYRFGRRGPPLSLAGLSAAELEEMQRSRNAVGYDQMALAMRHFHHRDSARRLFEKALELDPDDPLARDGLGPRGHAP